MGAGGQEGTEKECGDRGVKGRKKGQSDYQNKAEKGKGSHLLLTTGIVNTESNNFYYFQ